MLAPIRCREMHLKLAEILRAENYKGYVSIEMKRTTDVNAVFDLMNYIVGVFKQEFREVFSS